MFQIEMGVGRLTAVIPRKVVQSQRFAGTGEQSAVDAILRSTIGP
jgi:hypothetical protein